MGTQSSLVEIATVLKGLRRIVVMSHYNPDPDAYGSSCGLALTLRALGKEVVCVNESGILERLRWIPGVNEIRPALPEGSWDAIVACDCGDAKRVGDTLKDSVLAHPLLINIDHHASNDFFGRYNYVIPTACSTAELICDLVDALDAPWSPEIAICLYSGLSSDTGSFRYSSTTAKTFEMAQKLVAHGASPVAVAQHLYASNSLASVKLHAEAMSGLQLFFDNQVAQVKVPVEMLARNGATKEDADPLVDLARDIEGVRIAILFKQDDGIWRVSLRSKDSALDVARIASTFGGGGHRAAAGFRWRRSYEELETNLHREIAATLAGA